MKLISYENEKVKDLKLKKQMKGTKEMSKFTLYPSKYQSPYGANKQTQFQRIYERLGFSFIQQNKRNYLILISGLNYSALPNSTL